MNDQLIQEFLQMIAEKLKNEDLVADETQPITVKDVLLDFKLFASDMYEGTADCEDDDSVVITFANGQKFRIIVREIKLQLTE